MPRYSLFMIRTALFWLALGSTVGGLMLINKGVPIWPELWALRWVHVHSLLVGWTLQLACGVASWMLPRRTVHGWRGDIRLLWLGYIALNIGVVCAIIPGACAVIGVSAQLEVLYALAGLFYGIAATALVINAWPRLVPSLRGYT